VFGAWSPAECHCVALLLSLQLKASWTIAFWGPDTKDTGSILNQDWYTVNQEKMKLLQPIMYPNFQEKEDQ